VHQFKSDRDDKHHAKVWQEPYTDSYIEVDMNGYSGGGGTDEHIDHVEADSGATNPVSPVDHLVLSGTSGEIETSISDNGGGKATVTFSLADAANQTISEVSDDNAGSVSDVDILRLKDGNGFSWAVAANAGDASQAEVTLSLAAEWANTNSIIIGSDHWIDIAWNGTNDQFEATHDDPDLDDPSAETATFVNDVEWEDDGTGWGCDAIRLYFSTAKWDSKGHVFPTANWPADSERWAAEHSA
jgi:hypothetical protein